MKHKYYLLLKILQNIAISRFTLIVLGIFLQYSPLSALDPTKSIKQYGHDVWDVSKGFPYFVIHSIIQSPDGYLWASTDDGLIRFDGVQFTQFDSSNTPAIHNNNISTLCLDKSGVLWAGTRGGGIVSYQNGKFTHHGKEDGLLDENVQTLFVDVNDNIWLGIQNYGIVQWKDKRSRFFPSGKRGTYEGPMICLKGFKDGTVVSGIGGLIIKFPEVDSFISSTNNRGFVKTALEDRRGTKWVGGDQGLFTLSGTDLFPCTIPGAPTFKPISSLYEDHDGNIWVGTEGFGIYRYNQAAFDSFGLKNGLSSDRILSIYEDREYNLWLGTRGGGLFRLRDRNIIAYSQEDGLCGDYVNCVYEDRDSTIWIGTRDNGISTLHHGIITPQILPGKETQFQSVRSFMEDKHGNLYFGFQNGMSVINYNSSGNRIVHPIDIPMKFGAGVPVRCIYPDWKNDTLLLGIYGPGLFGYVNNKFNRFNFFDSTQRSGYIRRIVGYKDSSILLSTQIGIFQFRDTIIANYSIDNGFPNNQAFDIITEPDGTIWATSYGGGICRIKDKKIVVYTKRIGLYDDVIFTILDDSLGNYWMSGNKGIFSVPKQQLNDFADKKIQSINCVSYGLTDGMKSVECNGGSQFSGIRTHDGKLVFATVKGIVIIDPANLFSNTKPPPVQIELVIADDETLHTDKELSLQPGTRSVQFDYTGLSFVVPEKVRFKYFLEGFDDHWNEAGTRRRAYYTNIPTGEYKFRVMACNNSGIWNETGAMLIVNIPPFLWETSYFRVGAFLLVVFIVLGIVKYRENNIKKREQEKLQIQKQLMDLESRALRSQMNPHFIFNSLNSIQECILSEKTEIACEYLSKFARLIRIALESSEKTVIQLDKEIQSLELYLELESLRFEDKFEYHLHVAQELNEIPVEIPAMMIQPYAENSIWHGLLHKNGERKLSITVVPEGDYILCTIEDNGIGREKAATFKNIHKEGYESKGMRVTRERLEMIKRGTGKIASVSIIDLYDNQQQASGTRVELRIPVLK